jgi:hypothetical protein
MLDPLSVSIPVSSVGPARNNWPKRELMTRSPDHPDDYVMELDYSSLSNFMICPRKAENYSVKGRESCRDQSAMTFGHLFHALDAKRLIIGFTEEFARFKADKIAEHFVSYPCSTSDHRNSEMMEKVMAQYEVRYKGDGLREQLVYSDGAPLIERPFKVPLMTVAVNRRIKIGNIDVYVRNIHVIYTGRVDSALVQNGQYFVMDDKTSSRGGQEFEENFRLSLQTRGYCWALQKLLGVPVAGLILNAVIVRVPTKTGKGTEYNRRTYFYNPDLIAEFEDNIKAHVSSFIQCLVNGFFPQVALSFKSPCPSCDYHENCALPRHQRADDLASELYRDVTWNPMHEH